MKEWKFEELAIRGKSRWKNVNAIFKPRCKCLFVEMEMHKILWCKCPLASISWCECFLSWCECPLVGMSWCKCTLKYVMNANVFLWVYHDMNALMQTHFIQTFPLFSKRGFLNAWNQNILKAWFIILEKSSF